MKEPFEYTRLKAVHSDFTCTMKARLEQKHLEGFKGWDALNQYELEARAIAAMAEERYVDAANLTMMAWAKRREKLPAKSTEGKEK